MAFATGKEKSGDQKRPRKLAIPVIQNNAAAHLRSYEADGETQLALGFPDGLVDNWQEVALNKLAELVSKNRSLRLFFDTCVKCGACTDKCHYFLGTADPKNMPVARQDLLRKVYRRYFTLSGKWFPKLVGAVDLDRQVLEEWYTYFYQCSECRRCAVYCPIGIDTAEISMAGRAILNAVGLGQKYCCDVAVKVQETGNNLGMKKPALANVLEGLEEDVKDEINRPVRFPLDEKNAEVLLVTPSADFFAEPQVDGLIGYAKVFHQAGISWTLSSYASEAANFGIFLGDETVMRKMAQRIYDAALELGVKRIVVGECGHAWRVAYHFWEQLIGPFDFLDPDHRRPQHICEVTYELMQQGALRIDSELNDDKVVTFHDSCNVARGSSMGGKFDGQFTIPRAIINSVCRHYVEMAPESIRQNTFCCGGGGGLLTDELQELRVKGALPRMNALQKVVEQNGVTHIAAICAICKSQFSSVLPHYHHPREMVVSLHQLVGDALIFSDL